MCVIASLDTAECIALRLPWHSLNLPRVSGRDSTRKLSPHQPPHIDSVFERSRIIKQTREDTPKPLELQAFRHEKRVSGNCLKPLVADRARFRDYDRNAFILNVSRFADFLVPTYVPLYRCFIPRVGASLRPMPIVSRRALADTLGISGGLPLARCGCRTLDGAESSPAVGGCLSLPSLTPNAVRRHVCSMSERPHYRPYW